MEWYTAAQIAAKQRSHQSTDCCDCPALQPFSLNILCICKQSAQQSPILLGLGVTSAHPVRTAQKVAETDLGLRIRDYAGGIVYRSPATDRAFALQAMSVQMASFSIPASARQTAPRVVQGAHVSI
ncbi:hypothetical protein DFH09DRAFT_1077907 [Mycena vulgaris]|nr:hypothetical protein DFH09DRAFT_1077907 [Mycena vulgaris]